MKRNCYTKGEMVAETIRIKEGLLRRLRDVRSIPSEEVQARMIGVDRTTLRRIERGAPPSAAFMAGVSKAFGLGLSEAFDVVEVSATGGQHDAASRELVAS